MSAPGPLSTSTAPLGTTVLDGGGGPTPETVVRWVRAVLATCLGLGAAVFLAVSLVVAMSVQHAFDEEHPWAFMGVLLSVPQVRAEIAPDLVDDVEDQEGVTFSPAERAEAVDAVDDVLASVRLHDAFRDLTVVDRRVDGTAFVDVAAAVVGDRAREASPGVRAPLEAFVERLGTASEGDGAVAEVSNSADGVRELRRFGYGVAGVLAVPAVVGWLLAVAVARRRGLTAALVVSGGLLLASVLLAPGRALLDLLPGPLEVPGVVLATLGSLVGAGWVWSLVVWACVPPVAWVVARVLRTGRRRDEGARPLWVP